MNYFALSLTSLLLGFIHGFDTDHVIDVTDFVSQDPRPLQAAWFGARFGVGHTITVFTSGLAVYILKSAVPASLECAFQLFSGITLILLGVWGIHRRLFRPGKSLRHHNHNHAPEVNCTVERTKVDHMVFRCGPLVTGVITGIVGTAGVMLLGPVAVAPSVWWLAFFILLYGVGVIGAMCGYGLVVSKFFGSTFFMEPRGSVSKIVGVMPGFFSIALGSIWSYRIVTGFKGVVSFIK